MKKKLLALGLIATLVFSMTALTSCKDDETEAPAEEKKEVLTVGLDDTFAPMGFRDEEGNLVGFDIDVANALGEELGMDVEFKVIDWDAKVMELEAGTIDCVWNGMSITPERLEKMSLSDKYFNNKINVMALADADFDITDSAQLADYKIGTQVDSAALAQMKKNENYESFADNISEYKTYDLAIMDLKAGRVDVIVVDQVLGEYTNKNLDGAMKTCTYNFGDDFYVIGFAKDNEALRDKANEGMAKLFENGTTKEASEKWFGRDISVWEPLQ